MIVWYIKQYKHNLCTMDFIDEMVYILTLMYLSLYGFGRTCEPILSDFSIFQSILFLTLATKVRMFSEREDERLLLPSRIHVLLVPSSHWRTTTMFRHTHSLSLDQSQSSTVIRIDQSHVPCFCWSGNIFKDFPSNVQFVACFYGLRLLIIFKYPPTVFQWNMIGQHSWMGD